MACVDAEEFPVTMTVHIASVQFRGGGPELILRMMQTAPQMAKL